MKTRHFYYLLLFAALFTACEKAGDEMKGTKSKVQKELFSGYAQKGPFTIGSAVTMFELDANLNQTGNTYSTTIADNSGSFEKKNIELISNFVELKVDGYYFNEISGKTSIGQMTLYALVDVNNGKGTPPVDENRSLALSQADAKTGSANVNVLTHLEKLRVEYLVKQEGKSFSEAKQQAQREVLAIFGFEPAATTSEALNLTDDAALLAISCILQGYLSTGDMMELMAKIRADIETDGKLDNVNLGSKLMNNAYAVSLAIGSVRNNLTAKYAELGDNVIIPDFESYIQSFVDSGLYPRTYFITYPETGLYGDNILSNAVASVKKGPKYSMRAKVPEGLSLKIIVKGEYVGFSDRRLNWSHQYLTNYCHEFTVTESGTPSDWEFEVAYSDFNDLNNRDITIEYYENGSTTPTKVKKLYIGK